MQVLDNQQKITDGIKIEEPACERLGYNKTRRLASLDQSLL